MTTTVIFVIFVPQQLIQKCQWYACHDDIKETKLKIFNDFSSSDVKIGTMYGTPSQRRKFTTLIEFVRNHC